MKTSAWLRITSVSTAFSAVFFFFFFFRCYQLWFKSFSLLCNTIWKKKKKLHNVFDRKWCFRDCFFHIVLYINLYIYRHTFSIHILWMPESCICRHTLDFTLLALCVGLYMGTAPHGDQIYFHGNSVLHFPSLMVQKNERHRLPSEAV